MWLIVCCSVIVYYHNRMSKAKIDWHYTFWLADKFEHNSRVAMWWCLYVSLQAQGMLPGITAVQGWPPCGLSCSSPSVSASLISCTIRQYSCPQLLHHMRWTNMHECRSVTCFHEPSTSLLLIVFACSSVCAVLEWIVVLPSVKWSSCNY